MKRVIGSDENADIKLLGRYVAVEHAELTEIEDKVYLQDLNSQFGTFVNGKKIQSKTELLPADRVKIGTQLFHWQDYLENSSKEISKYPIHIKDLFDPRGLIDWDSYKIAFLILIGFLVLTPLAVPSFLIMIPNIFGKIAQKRIEELDLLQYSGELIILFCLVLIYIIINITQKFIRLKPKNSQ